MLLWELLVLLEWVPLSMLLGNKWPTSNIGHLLVVRFIASVHLQAEQPTPIANAINVLQACIYKSVKIRLFLNHLWPQVLSNSTIACFSVKELGI